MQLLLIFQISIAMLAGELRGTLGLGEAASVSIALAGPLLALLCGTASAARAARAMDRQDPAAVDRMHRTLGRLRASATVCMLVAAMGRLPCGSPEYGGGFGCASFLLACGLVATVATMWASYPVERRIREASLVRQLDGGFAPHAVPTRAQLVLAQVRTGLLPLFVPLAIPLVAGEVARQLAARHAPGSEESWQVAGAAIGAAALFLLVPLLVPILLGLRRLEAGPLRTELEQLSADSGVAVDEIWVWPTDGLVANAAVMGLLPRLRCVMLTDALLEYMPREQVRAVMAHELGHVARRHLLWLVAIVVACWAVAGAVAQPLVESAYHASAAAWPDGGELLQVAVLARDGLVLALGLVLFGWISRRFERQADTFAVQLLSRREGRSDASPAAVDAMVGALGSVAFLNHVPGDRPSWRHGSIRWRQDYLRGLVGRDHGALAIDTLVACLKWGALAVAVAALVVDLATI